jgi:hypothetical protein
MTCFSFGVKMNRQFLTGVFAVGAMSVGMFALMDTAEAATLVQNGGGTVTGINGLTIGTSSYNVDFNNANFTSLFGSTGTSPQPTFWQNQTGAQDAANAINSFLTGQNQLGNIFLGNANSYLVAFNLIPPSKGNGPGTVAGIKGLSGNPWTSSFVDDVPQNGGGNQPVYAVFSAVPPTAIPTPALLPGLIGMGLAAMRKKKQAAEVAQEV